MNSTKRTTQTRLVHPKYVACFDLTAITDIRIPNWHFTAMTRFHHFKRRTLISEWQEMNCRKFWRRFPSNRIANYVTELVRKQNVTSQKKTNKKKTVQLFNCTSTLTPIKGCRMHRHYPTCILIQTVYILYIRYV